ARGSDERCVELERYLVLSRNEQTRYLERKGPQLPSILARYGNQGGSAIMRTLGKIAATLGVVGAIAVGSAAPAAAYYYQHHYYHHHHHYGYHSYYHHRHHYRHYYRHY